jgi:hypothetical protein
MSIMPWATCPSDLNPRCAGFSRFAVELCRGFAAFNVFVGTSPPSAFHPAE